MQPASPGGALDDSVEDRLHIRGRSADDAEHFGCRSLMLQRLAQFCVAFLKFLKQTYVLNSDDGLISEGFEERYLLFRKGANLRTTYHNGPDRNPFSKQRRDEDSSSAEASLVRFVFGELGLGLCDQVMNVK